MVSSVYDLVAREAEALPSNEQLRLIARLAANRVSATADDRPRWEDFSGSVSAPLCGEDAQEWVTRTRQESYEKSRN
jgi:hypothetical protein